MPDEIVTSAQNPLIKRIRSVKTRKGRQRERAFWVEGLAPVMEAIDAGWNVETVVRAPDLLRSEEAEAFLDARDLPQRLVTGAVFEKVSDRDGPAGLGAIVSTRDDSLGALEIGPTTLLTVLVEPQDPGNLGTIVRTAYCAGSSGVVLVGASTDPYDPRAVRASMGALFRLPVVREGKVAGLIEWAGASGIRLVGTSARASADYRSADYGAPVAIVLGNEQKGIPEDLASACDTLVTIPMRGTLKSLNLSAAGAVVLYEAAYRSGLHG